MLLGMKTIVDHGYVHRDLKPENTFITKGKYQIADFGFCYVAPEIVNLKDMKAKYDCICDIFSVGIIFHLLALRKSPFPGR